MTIQKVGQGVDVPLKVLCAFVYLKFNKEDVVRRAVVIRLLRIVSGRAQRRRVVEVFILDMVRQVGLSNLVEMCRLRIIHVQDRR